MPRSKLSNLLTHARERLSRSGPTRIEEKESRIAALEARNAVLEAKNAELERFNYTVSHDLKSPLITIKGFIGLLRQDASAGDTERMEHDIRRISDAADGMNRLVDELLRLTRVGTQTISMVEVPLGDLVRDVVELISGQIEERSVKIEIAEDLPVCFVDRIQMFGVFQNLIQNAVKYMGEEPEPKIEIGARRSGTERTLFVRDNGMGIDARYHEKVFGLFERLQPGTGEGTGIGLTLVKRIVERHEGRVWVESQGVGQGSTFCFTLPRCAERKRRKAKESFLQGHSASR